MIAQATAARPRAAAREGRLVERARDQVEPHPERDHCQPGAAVVEVAAEQHAHYARADGEQPERDRAGESRDRERSVTRTARSNSSCPLVASRSARWGSSEVWIDWKSCSGARAISSTLKTKPASAASSRSRSGEHGGVEERLLGEHDDQHRDREARAAAQAQLDRALLGGLGRRALLGGVELRRPAAPSGAGRARRANAAGTTTSDTNGAAAIPIATAD